MARRSSTCAGTRPATGSPRSATRGRSGPAAGATIAATSIFVAATILVGKRTRVVVHRSTRQRTASSDGGVGVKLVADVHWSLHRAWQIFQRELLTPAPRAAHRHARARLRRHDRARRARDHVGRRAALRRRLPARRPGVAAPFPAILIRMPYGKQEAYCYMPSHGKYWARRGYACVIQDVRGRWGSEGVYEPFVNEAKDGYETLDWVAAQPWCDGKIGMTGESYYGYTQWAVAPLGPSQPQVHRSRRHGRRHLRLLDLQRQRLLPEHDGRLGLRDQRPAGLQRVPLRPLAPAAGRHPRRRRRREQGLLGVDGAPGARRLLGPHQRLPALRGREDPGHALGRLVRRLPERHDRRLAGRARGEPGGARATSGW